jgi:hypothetical protein
MTGKKLLEQSIATIEERGKVYGTARDNFDMIAKRWSLTLGVEVTSTQVGLMMIDLKVARLQKSPDHYDSIVDIAGYAACLADLTNKV